MKSGVGLQIQLFFSKRFPDETVQNRFQTDTVELFKSITARTQNHLKLFLDGNLVLHLFKSIHNPKYKHIGHFVHCIAERKIMHLKRFETENY